MNRAFLFFLIYLCSITSSHSNEREVKLNQLFDELKVNKAKVAAIVAQEIWSLWSTHPTDQKLTSMLDEGSRLVQDRQLSRAISVFSDAIELDPLWAEAWNKRATVFYMVGEFQKSQDDIDKVLELENRHFGALAGQGMVNIKLKNYDKAKRSYQKAQEIYPALESPKVMIEQIEELIKRQSI
jgi:tetratricopeptide (TPR) repeat protein